MLRSEEHALCLLAIPAVALNVLRSLSVTYLTQAIGGDKTYPIEVRVVNVALLKRALDFFLGVLRQCVETVDQLNIVLCRLPPVVEDGRRYTAPITNVSSAL